MSDREYFAARVISTERLSRSMIRIVFGGNGLRGFRSSNVSDEFVRLLFPHDRADHDNGNALASLDGAPGRYYTIRQFDEETQQVAIDFACHEDGIAGKWCVEAKPGDVLGLCPRGYKFELPADAQWITILSDITGLPAVARTIETLRENIPTVAHVEIPHREDRQHIETAADVALHWYETFGRNSELTRLFEIARSVSLPEGPGYIWIAGEALAVSQSRRYFRDVLGFDKDRITSVGYWIKGKDRG